LQTERTEESKAESIKLPSWFAADTEETQKLRSHYSQQKLNKIHDGLNRPPPSTEADIQVAENDLDVNTNPPGKDEIIADIMSLKNKKFPGQDNLMAEIFKVDPQLAADLLQPLFTDIWNWKTLPDD